MCCCAKKGEISLCGGLFGLGRPAGHGDVLLRRLMGFCVQNLQRFVVTVEQGACGSTSG